MRQKTIVDRQTAKHDEMNKKLVHMIRFIELEGIEKAEEIDLKTEEEFNILKGKIIQEERNEVLKYFTRKEHECTLRSHIHESQILQEGTISLVDRKMELYDDIEKEIKIRLFLDLSCPKKRWNVIKNLIIESLFKLLEKDVIIKCRFSEESMIINSLTELQFIYRECAGKNVNIKMDSNFLPDKMLPGVIVRTPNNKISVDNTLDSRLKQVIRNCLPVTNNIFFGTSKFESNTVFPR